jgi:hypothetical protein
MPEDNIVDASKPCGPEWHFLDALELGKEGFESFEPTDCGYGAYLTK